MMHRMRLHRQWLSKRTLASTSIDKDGWTQWACMPVSVGLLAHGCRKDDSVAQLKCRDGQGFADPQSTCKVAGGRFPATW